MSIESKIENNFANEEKLREKRRAIESKMADLIDPIKSILLQLHEEINKGSYELILGDDASGRIPTLLVGKTIKNLYKENRVKNPEIRFFSGDARSTELAQYIDSLKKEIKLNGDKKVLITTDTIDTGTHLYEITKALKTNHINFDIATIGLLRSHAVPELEKKLGGKIVYGQSGLPKIYGQHDIAGVIKTNSELHARSYRKWVNGTAISQKIINIPRGKKIDAISRNITDWYKYKTSQLKKEDL